jgi:hypothetical protein
VNNPEDLGDCSTLLGELTIDRRVLGFDASTQVQEFPMVAHTRDFQISLPSAHVDRSFQLVVFGT